MRPPKCGNGYSSDTWGKSAARDRGCTLNPRMHQCRRYCKRNPDVTAGIRRPTGVKVRARSLRNRRRFTSQIYNVCSLWWQGSVRSEATCLFRRGVINEKLQGLNGSKQQFSALFEKDEESVLVRYEDPFSYQL